MATSMLVGLLQLLLPAIAFFNDIRPHCMGFRANPGVPAVVLAAALWWTLLDVVGKGFLADLLWLDRVPDTERVRIIVFDVLTFGVIYLLFMYTKWRVAKRSPQPARS